MKYLLDVSVLFFLCGAWIEPKILHMLDKLPQKYILLEQEPAIKTMVPLKDLIPV